MRLSISTEKGYNLRNQTKKILRFFSFGRKTNWNLNIIYFFHLKIINKIKDIINLLQSFSKKHMNKRIYDVSIAYPFYSRLLSQFSHVSMITWTSNPHDPYI